MQTDAALQRHRLKRVEQALVDRKIDALLLCPGADLFYLTGFEHGHAGERLLALIVRRDGSSRWIVPQMNVPQLRPHVLSEQPVASWGDSQGFAPALAEALSGATSIAFDEEARAGFVLDVMSAAPAASIERSGTILRELRLRKDPAELAALRAAGDTVDQTIATAMSLCRPGRTELEVERDLRSALLARSPQSSVAFTIVASGPNAALPHHETSHRSMQRGEVVILDFGTRLNGYHSDITVTCSIGEPADPEAHAVYKTVWRAQKAAIDAVRPNVSCESIDRAARDVIDAAGYGEFFVHRTGHGLGLQVHEPPFMVGGNRQVLEEGMVFSIEPGIYLPGRFGVRLEIITAVGRNGAELINTPRPPTLPIMLA